jgi:signal transduction histidine kinase
MIQDARATVSTGMLPALLCDSSQIRQLLQNLITNALKYRDKSRIPQIEIGCVIEDLSAADGESPQRQARISVSDNGIGFDEKFCEQVFEPFQRLHGPDQYEGTGIGLAICRKIVHRHGGSIWSSSRPGKGSSFTFTLPYRGTSAEVGRHDP